MLSYIILSTKQITLQRSGHYDVHFSKFHHLPLCDSFELTSDVDCIVCTILTKLKQLSHFNILAMLWK